MKGDQVSSVYSYSTKVSHILHLGSKVWTGFWCLVVLKQDQVSCVYAQVSVSPPPWQQSTDKLLVSHGTEVRSSFKLQSMDIPLVCDGTQGSCVYTI